MSDKEDKEKIELDEDGLPKMDKQDYSFLGIMLIGVLIITLITIFTGEYQDRNYIKFFGILCILYQIVQWNKGNIAGKLPFFVLGFLFIWLS